MLPRAGGQGELAVIHHGRARAPDLADGADPGGGGVHEAVEHHQVGPLAEVIESALGVAGVKPETVGYVECHATGTMLG
ncbi:hypothetical protein AB0K48_57525, partial [Nonomuraea sp. NPDC055795]